MTALKNGPRPVLALCGFFALFVLGLSLLPASSKAQGGGAVIIRDTEIENMLHEWMLPIFKAAEIPAESVNIILVQSNQINAFVAGGANIFLYTGLLTKSDNPGEVIGVLSHELGHIKGGHLIAAQAAIERASYESIIGTILGLGAAIATGNSDAAVAISTGSGSMALRRYLAHSRVQESSADQAAMSYFEKAGMNPTGLISFMEKLGAQDLLPASQQVEYALTHPLTQDRIDALEARARDNPASDKALPAAWTEQHARMKAKLTGFIEPGRVPWTYDDTDKSMAARYARAIAAYRENRVEESLKELDALLKDEPNNPYFLELKGQALVDFARGDQALPYYRKSVEILGEAPLIRLSLGHALIESARGDEKTLREAITNLERALKKEPRSTRAHRLLATAYGQLGEESRAKLHLAEEAVLQNRRDYARELAEGVVNTTEKGSRDWLQAKDILLFIDNMPDKKG